MVKRDSSNQVVTADPMAEALQAAEQRLVEAGEGVANCKNWTGNLQAAQQRANTRAGEVQAGIKRFQQDWSRAFVENGQPEPSIGYRALMEELSLLSGTMTYIADAILDSRIETTLAEAVKLDVQARVYQVRAAIAEGALSAEIEAVRAKLKTNFVATLHETETSQLLEAADGCIVQAGRLRKQAQDMRERKVV